ncbi:MAG: DUF2079 domain-containing protein [Candidatus Bathyarchaeia archaeon]|nr:DUF2079 domain-containing protein [Candidatus Bathyarchaeota archaeon]
MMEENNFWGEKIEKLLRKTMLKLKFSEWLIIAMTIIYSVVFSYYTIMRHYSFRSNAWDLGILVQSIASAAQGRLFTNNVELYYSPTGSYFGVHFAPILFLTIPFFYLIPKVETILVLQSIVLALGAIPIYLLSDFYFNNKFAALMIAVTYLLNPHLQGINWYDFHTQAFFPLMIISAIYFFKRKKYWMFFLFIVLSLSTMEQSVPLVALLIPQCMVDTIIEYKKSNSKRKWIHIFALLSLFTIIATWMLISTYVKNTINPNPPMELKAVGNYRILGIEDPVEIPLRALLYPDLALKALRFDLPYKILYIVSIFAPNCFISLLSPLTLLPAFLWIFMASLSNWPPYYQLGYQYSAFTVPFVTMATIESLKKIIRNRNNENNKEKLLLKMTALLLIVGTLLSLCTSPLSFIYEPGCYTYFRDYGVSMPSLLEKKVLELLSEIPMNATILTTPTIFPHISTNIGAYVIPPLDAISKRLFESHIKYLKKIEFDYILISYFWDKNEAEFIYRNFLANNSKYGLFVKAPGLELYKRHYNREPLKITIRLTHRELFKAESSVVVEDPSSTSGTVILLRASKEAGRYAWYGPYITLSPGTYTVRFRIKVDSLPSGKILKLDVWSNSLKTEIVSVDLYGDYFIRPLIWHIFTLTFSLSERLSEIEFRGLEVTSNVSVFLDYVEIEPH